VSNQASLLPNNLPECENLLFVEVALNKPLYQTYTYAIQTEATTTPPSLLGKRVEVPLGRSSAIGIITKHLPSEQQTDFKIKYVTQVIDQEPLLSQQVLDTLTWASDYFFQPIGEMIFAFIPVKLRDNTHLENFSEVYWELSKTSELEIAKNAKKQRIAIDTLTKYGPLPMADLKAKNVSSQTLAALLKKDIVEKSLITPAAQLCLQPKPDNQQDTNIQLTTEQKQAIQTFLPTLTKHSTTLLEGVTGSGKTEVYLEIAKHILQQDQQLLILLPEIGLTNQLLDRFTSALNYPVITLHSDMAQKNRASQWLSCKTDTPIVVLGTRSALGCELPNLAAIIIDEEHDSSYKQQDGVRYHGRSLAQMRAAKQNIPVLLGSATPSLESMHNVKNNLYFHSEMKQRATGVALPKIHFESNWNSEQIFADETIRQLQQTLENNQKALIFLNRRGFAPTLQCNRCLWVAECDHCDTTMTVHYKRHTIECHHCNNIKPLPEQCPKCHSPYLTPMGTGTERLEQFIKAQFKDTAIYRIDRDTTRNRDSLSKIKQQIEQQSACILIGTQMIAKGHNFSNLALTVILNADNGLFSQDFRGSEKLIQNLLQVAGRTGRGSEQGQVIIQTHYPEHILFHQFKQHDYQAFTQQELTHREHHALPPFQHNAVIRLNSQQPNKGAELLAPIAETLRKFKTNQNLSPSTEITGPLPAIIEKKSNWYRYLLMLSSPSRKELHAILNEAKTLLLNSSQQQVRWVIDVDPIDTL
jgi:primosomal protein N' (replication factor Y)